MKQTIKLSEQELKGIIRESIMEMLPEEQPQPKFKQGDMVAVNYNAADNEFGPDGQPAIVGNVEWCEPENEWKYFCIHPRLPRRGWFNEGNLKPLNKNLNETISKVLKEHFDTDNSADDYSETISFSAMNNILHQFGLSISGYRDVENRSTGETGIRYELDSPKNVDTNALENALKKAATDPDGVFVSIGQHKYAPEIKRISVVVVNP
jgi:hypothetical protein